MNREARHLAPIGQAGRHIVDFSDVNHRHQRIRVAAYFRAEKRGFAPGRALDDWLEAEREIDAESVPFPGY